MRNNPKPIIGDDFHCPVCNKTKSILNNISVALDHNHHTEEIKSFICLACNTVMG